MGAGGLGVSLRSGVPYLTSLFWGSRGPSASGLWGPSAAASCTPGPLVWWLVHPGAPRPGPRSESPSGWQSIPSSGLLLRKGVPVQLPGLGCCSQERLGYSRGGPGLTPLTPGLAERWPCVQAVVGVDFNARIKVGGS